MTIEELKIARGQMITVPDGNFEMIAAMAMQGILASGKCGPDCPEGLALLAKYSHDAAEAMQREAKRRWQSRRPSPAEGS